MSTVIESIIRRKGGTKVRLNGTEYHFTPDEEGRHVAEVSKNAHIQRFLAVPEGFRLLDDEDEGEERDGLNGGLQPNEGGDEPSEEEVSEMRGWYKELTGNDGEGMTFEQLSEAVEVAEAESRLNDSANSADDDADSDADPEPEPEPGVTTEPKADEVPLERQDPATVDEAALRAHFEEVIGEKAHPRMKVENIQARIIETKNAVGDDD